MAELYRESHEQLHQAPLQYAFLASHYGTDARGIIAAIERQELKGKPAVVISNNKSAPALLYAKEKGIPFTHINQARYGTPESVDETLRDTLLSCGIDVVF